jgi:hypothetical protein
MRKYEYPPKQLMLDPAFLMSDLGWHLSYRCHKYMIYTRENGETVYDPITYTDAAAVFCNVKTCMFNNNKSGLNNFANISIKCREDKGVINEIFYEAFDKSRDDVNTILIDGDCGCEIIDGELVKKEYPNVKSILYEEYRREYPINCEKLDIDNIITYGDDNSNNTNPFYYIMKIPLVKNALFQNNYSNSYYEENMKDKIPFTKMFEKCLEVAKNLKTVMFYVDFYAYYDCDYDRFSKVINENFAPPSGWKFSIVGFKPLIYPWIVYEKMQC